MKRTAALCAMMGMVAACSAPSEEPATEEARSTEQAPSSARDIETNVNVAASTENIVTPAVDVWHCPNCGCTTPWTPTDPAYPRMAVKVRMFDPALLRDLPRRLIDGASY